MGTSNRFAAARKFLSGSHRCQAAPTTSGVPGQRRGVLSLRLVFAAVVLALLALATCAALASAAGSGADESASGGETASSSQEVPREPEGVEIKSARTATSDSFTLPDGEREARLYETPVNEEVSPGQWRPIGEEELEAGGTTALGGGESELELHLPARLGAGPVRLTTGGEWIAARLLGGGSQPGETEGDAADYEIDGSDTSFEMSGLPNGVKENIEVPDAASPSTFHFELSTSQGLTPRISDDGSVAFRGEAGKEVAKLPAPVMYDSSGSPAGISSAVEYHLESASSGGWLLTVEASREWLDAPGRVWPVEIDPSIVSTRVAPYFDCMLASAPTIETWNYCAQNGYPHLAAQAWYYNLPHIDEFTRSVVFFRLIGAIPDTASVTEAAMHLYSARAAESTKGIEALSLGQPWSNYVSWKYSGYPNCATCEPWTTPGGTVNTAAGVNGRIGELTTAAQGAGGKGWWSVALNEETVQRWVSGNTNENLGVLVRQLGEKEHECTPTCLKRTVEFESSAAPTEEDRPYLSVTYIPKGPITSKMSSPTEGTHTPRRLKLASSWEVGGVEGVTFQYREGKTGTFRTIPTGLVQTAEGKAVSWPLSVGFGERQTKPVYFDAAHSTPTLRKKGGIVQVRAWFRGATGADGYSAPVETIVDRGLGGAKDPTASVGPGTVDLLTGNFDTTATDVSIPTFDSSLGFSRSYNSRGPGLTTGTESPATVKAEEAKSILGPGWKPGLTLEAEGGSSWTGLKIVEEKEPEFVEYEGGELEQVGEYGIFWAVVSGLEGASIPFEKQPDGSYQAPPEATGWTLTAEGSNFVLADPSGDRTTFSPGSASNEYVPSSFSFPGTATTSGVEYETVGGKKRIRLLVAPAAAGVTCGNWPGIIYVEGCKLLYFQYAPATKWGAPAEDGERLSSITYIAPGLAGPPWEVARFGYDTQGRLIEEWDGRISPALKTRYTYGSSGELKTITPPGQEPWTLEYGTVDEEEGVGRLVAVKRPSLLASPNNVATTTISYEVPLSGSGLPEMQGSAVAQWGQEEIPTDATAVFPPDQVPTSNPPGSYSHATIHYMDAEGYEVDTAAPPGGGAASWSISTAETDEYGDVARELSPDNRLRVLAEPACEHWAEEKECPRRKLAEALDTRRVFHAKGTQMVEEIGPRHQVRLESGESVEARFHKVVQYDLVPAGETLPTPDPNLPTRETTGAWVEGALREERVTETKYKWSLRKPTRSIVVMEAGKPSSNIETATAYEEATGLPVESSQPKAVAGGGAAKTRAGTTRTIYYSPGTENIAACVSSLYAGMPCKVEPVEQPGTVGQPELLVTKYPAYDALGQPTEVTESPGGGITNLRKTLRTYDSAGRLRTTKIEGGGAAIPTAEVVYEESTGLPWKQQFVGGAKATSVVRNAIGQAVEYEDADGNRSKTTYDIDGRPVTVSDAKGTQTYHYNETSGLLTSLEDSAAGTFTASYDADGNLIERGLPDGLTAKTTYNPVDEPIGLAYTKTSSCGESCTWYEENLQRSIQGQVLTNTGTLVSDQYSYDKDGRLTRAEETPTAGGCTTREYSFDLDSNRLSKTTRGPGVGGACVTSGGTPQDYEYDSADRLLGEGLTYDAFGRITNLPAEFTGGKALETTYFSTNMVASQTQNGVTNSYEIDPTGRQRQRIQAGGVAGTEIFHYDGPGDSPSWTSLGSTWSRNVTGIGGELAAVQESGGTVTFKLTDLHGDVVAAAGSNPTATKLLATYRFDEFGEPESGGAGRFGWQGGKSRRTELSSGVIQMGARSYIPQLGRFLTPDPIRGGSANSYDYAYQDPINMFDLSGEIPCPGNSKKKNCLGPPSPQQVRQANRTHVIAAHFTSQAAAQRFVHMLKAAPSFTAGLVRQSGEWKAEEIQAVQAKVAKANEIARWAGSPPKPAPETSGEDCTDASDATAGTIFVIAAAPETAGASLVIGAIGLAVGVTGNHVC
jgi:RHS repeat-associated protein